MSLRPHRRYLEYVLLSVAVSALALPAYIQLFPMNFAAFDYPIWSQQIEFARTPTDEEPEVLIFGDSRIHAAMVPGEFPARTRSLALGGSTPIDAYYLLELYLEHHRAPGTIFLSFAPYHLEEIQLKRFWDRTVKFKAWAPRADLEVLERSRALGIPLISHRVRHGPYVEWLLTRFNFPLYYAPELKNAKLLLRRRSNLETRERVARGSGHLLYGTEENSSEHNQEVGRTSFELSPLQASYLRSFLDRALSVDAFVVMAAMPLNQSSFDALDPGYIETWGAAMLDLGEEYPLALVVPELAALPDDHFGDRSHVNARGARAVSRHFAALVD